MTLLALATGRLGVDLAPASGGAVARFAVDGVDVLRPMAGADIASGRGNNAALYPLVPFSNRIRDGRLAFEGEQFQLARNWPGVGHPMHGDGWAHAWDVVRSDRTRRPRSPTCMSAPARRAAGRSAIAPGSRTGWTTTG